MGLRVVIPGRGFIMNNTMADFSPKVGVRTTQGLAYGMANAVRPGKTPLSSMSPTIVLKDGEPVLAVGSAGGPRIITSTLQLIINTLDYGMMMDSAVKTPHMCCLTQRSGPRAGGRILARHGGLLAGDLNAMEQRDRHVDSDGPAGKVRQLRVTGKDGDEQLGTNMDKNQMSPAKTIQQANSRRKASLTRSRWLAPKLKPMMGWAPWVSP